MLKLLGPEGRKQLGEAKGAATIGIEMGLSVAFGYLGGGWLDRHLDSGPYLTYLGLAVGIAAGFKSLFVIVAKHRARETEN